MKLNDAAALFASFRRPALAPTFVLLTLLATVLVVSVAPAASALDGIDLSEPAAATAEGECPRLIQIKYPFLACTNGLIGQSSEDETWDNSRSIALMSSWTEGDGEWGPTLNLE